MATRKFRFTQTNSTPFSGLDGTVVFGNGTDTTDKILLLGASGLGMDGLQVQTQKAPFQQGASPIRTLFDTRLITLECAIAVPGANSKNASTVTTIKRNLSKKLSPVGMGFMPDTSLLTSTYSTYTGQLAYAADGVTYDRFIDAVPMKIEYPNAYYQDSFQKMRVVFFCAEPFWYGSTQTQTLSAISLIPVGVTAYSDMAYAPSIGTYVLVGQDSTKVLYSKNGISWTAGTGMAFPCSSVDWSPTLGLFVAVGNRYFFSSPDGVTWTQCFDGAAYTGVMTKIRWFDTISKFVVVTTDNKTIHSSNSTAWTAYTVGIVANFRDICYSEQLGKFCMVGDRSAANTGTVGTSTDCQTWTITTSTLDAFLSGVVWSRILTLFVASSTFDNATNNKFILTSPEGTTWTRQSTGTYQLYSIAVDQTTGNLVAIGHGTYVLRSSDGVTWTVATAPSNVGVVRRIDSFGFFALVPYNVSAGMITTETGASFTQSSTANYFGEINNAGDVTCGFQITIPVNGGETGKKVVVSENYLWDGSATPPNDHSLVFTTDGMSKGNVIIDTTFGKKSITQFGANFISSFSSGMFFSLYISSSSTVNTLFVWNTGVSAGAPTVTWKNRYITV